MREYIGRSDFTWFVGVVEDRNDPVELGRVRVRAYGWHNESLDAIPTNELPWAIPVNGVSSASVSGFGNSPTGLFEGSWVIGFFADGERAQEPMILGSLAGIPTNLADTALGFNDPNGKYPTEVNIPDVNKLARGENTKVHELDTTIPEPAAPYAAVYPYNHVYESESGHTKEYDDTPDAERIRERHKSGTFYEVHPNGDRVTHIVNNNYTIVASNNDVHIKGVCNLFIDQDCNTTIGGDWNINVTGDKNETIGGEVVETYSKSKTTKITDNIVESVGGSVTEDYTGSQKTSAASMDINGGSAIDMDAGRIDLN